MTNGLIIGGHLKRIVVQLFENYSLWEYYTIYHETPHTVFPSMKCLLDGVTITKKINYSYRNLGALNDYTFNPRCKSGKSLLSGMDRIMQNIYEGKIPKQLNTASREERAEECTYWLKGVKVEDSNEHSLLLLLQELNKKILQLNDKHATLQPSEQTVIDRVLFPIAHDYCELLSVLRKL